MASVMIIFIRHLDKADFLSNFVLLKTTIFARVRCKNMHRFLLVAFLCFFAVSTTGCKKAKIRAQLKELIGCTIVLPDHIMCVYNGEIFPMADSVRKKAKMIVYVDSSECHTCKLSQLVRYEQLYQLSEETGKFEFVFMLGNTHFGGITLFQYLSDLNLNYPVYVDEEQLFLINNPRIPDERLFHNMFLSSENKVKFVGDPILNERVKSILERTLLNEYY